MSVTQWFGVVAHHQWADGSVVSGEQAIDSASAPETYFWPLFALVVVIVPQVLVPARWRDGPAAYVPIIETVVALVLLGVAARPGPVPQTARPLILSLIGVLLVDNTLAAVRLASQVLHGIVPGGHPPTVDHLMASAGIVLATNIVTFGLLYWQLDGGGPGGRLNRIRPYPDFQFPQTESETLAPPDWQPRFPDHLYVAFTNVVAFSPTVTMPLTHRAKALMALQSLISLSLLVLVLARVINILPN